MQHAWASVARACKAGRDASLPGEQPARFRRTTPACPPRFTFTSPCTARPPARLPATPQARIVPLIVEYDAFWTRYFYRLHKLEQKHAQFVQLTQVQGAS